MNRLQELIQTLCPDGIEFRSLKNVCKFINTGKLNANAMVKDGIYPFFTCDAKPFRINEYAFNTEAIIVSGNGSQVGHINYYKGKFNAYQRTYVLSKFIPEINVFFLFYYLKCNLKKHIIINSKKGSVPYITLPILQNFGIPIPPLAVQEEIVRILDAFTSYAAELQAELQARKEQYAYYRDQLLTFDEHAEGVEWKKLGEIGTFTRGNGLQKKDFTETGFPCIHYGQIHTHYGTFADTTISYTSNALAQKLRKASYGDLIIATTSEDVEGVCKACTWLGKEDVAVSGDSYIYKHNQNPKYIAYLFQTKLFYEYKRKAAIGTKVVRVTGKSMENFIFPIPSLIRQQRIVAILDKFEALVNDLTEGLPAEIAAVQEQYEYYRNKLLSFPKITEA